MPIHHIQASTLNLRLLLGMKLSLTTLATAALGCNLQKDIVVGYQQDLSSTTTPKTPEECCTLCNKTPDCVAFTYSSNKCWLKKGSSATKAEPGSVSGLRDGPLPTLPPTPLPTFPPTPAGQTPHQLVG